MEELDLRSSSGIAKFLGALASVLEAFIITLYKGQKILSTSPFTESPRQLLQSQKSNWVLAGLLLAIAFLSFALSNIFQVKYYPPIKSPLKLAIQLENYEQL